MTLSANWILNYMIQSHQAVRIYSINFLFLTSNFDTIRIVIYNWIGMEKTGEKEYTQSMDDVDLLCLEKIVLLMVHDI